MTAKSFAIAIWQSWLALFAIAGRMPLAANASSAVMVVELPPFCIENALPDRDAILVQMLTIFSVSFIATKVLLFLRVLR